MKKLLLLCALLAPMSLAFGQSSGTIVKKKKILSATTGSTIATYALNEGRDTLLVTLYKEFNINKTLPEMTMKLRVDPKTLKYLKETQPNGSKVYRELSIVIPDSKGNKKPKDKAIKPLKSPKVFSASYALGRHTDQLSGVFRYAGSFGIEGAIATSLHRGDVLDNYLYLGLSQDLDGLYYTKWQGHFSLGPIVLAEAGKNEFTPGLVVIGELQRQIDDNFYFGPKIMLGTFNEFSFSISTRF
jgi:hypothetical protein